MKLLSLLAAVALVSSAVDAKTFLFPVPQETTWSGTSVGLSSHFKINGIKNQNVQAAADRYLSLIKKERWVPVSVPATKTTVKALSSQLTGINVQVSDNHVKLDVGVDESYSLVVPQKGGVASLKAKTWVGALRALETFSQLVEADKNNKLVVHSASITDAPTYGHRGVLLDTARNYYPVNSILRILDAMAYQKMNVFHWHATDSQSWPLYFKNHPELSQKGAYSNKETYTPNQVKQIISYAEARGIRVIVEIDSPAHTASIGDSHPDYLLCADEFWAAYAAEPPAGQINPINPKAVKLIDDLLLEGASRFPDTLIHTGGDEINTACWELYPEIKNYIKKKGFSSTKEIWFEYTNNLLKNLKKKTKKRAIIWEDGVKDGGDFPKDTIIHQWVNPVGNYTSLGYDVIVSAYDYFYLDCGHGGWVGNDNRYISPTQTQTADDVFNYGGVGGSWCSPFKTWQRIYSYDMTYGVSKSDKGKVLGGEVAVWSEQTDAHAIEPRLFPRASAAAEVYWSGSYDSKGKRRTIAQVSERFYDWVYRLQARGINAEPVQPKWCARNPGGCDLSDPHAKSN